MRTPVPADPTDPVPGASLHRTRPRRLRLFAPAFVLIALLGYSSLHQVWYSATLAPSTVLGVSGVSAHAELTGGGLAGLNADPALQGSTATNTNPKVSAHVGIVDPVFWLLVAALLGTLGALAASSMASLAGLATAFFAWQSLLTLRAQVEQPRTWGGFTVLRGPGQQRLWLALTMLATGLVLCAVQTLLARHHAHQVEKALHPEKESPSMGLLTGLVKAGILGALLRPPADTEVPDAAFAEHGGTA